MLRTRWSCLLFAVVLFALGCSRAPNDASVNPIYSADSPSGGAYPEAEANYAYKDDAMEEMEAEDAPASIVSRSRGRMGKGARADKKQAKNAPIESDDWGAEGDAMEPEPAPAPDEVAPLEPQQGRDQSREPQTEPTSQSKSKRRQVIYTATMAVAVYDLPGALIFVEEIPTRYGGWLEQRVDNQFVLRVPAGQLEPVMDALAELGQVQLRTLEGLDVTAAYTDLESRIRILEEMQAQLQALLERAETVEQSLEIRRVLDQITLELESARAQMRSLAQSIAFSTLTLSLSERGPGEDLPSTNDPFPWVDGLGAEATEYR